MVVDKPTTEDRGGDVPDPLRKNLEWYIANQQSLSAEHNGKVLLIVDQKLIGAYNTMGEAYTRAMKDYQPGTFTLQPCSPDPDSYTLTVYSPSYRAIA